MGSSEFLCYVFFLTVLFLFQVINIDSLCVDIIINLAFTSICFTYLFTEILEALWVALQTKWQTGTYVFSSLSDNSCIIKFGANEVSF